MEVTLACNTHSHSYHFCHARPRPGISFSFQINDNMQVDMKAKGYVYFITNKTNSVLYTGVTNSIVRRMTEHGEHRGSSFTAKYNCTKLVYFEVFPDIEQAIQREKQLKHFKREWKDQLITAMNPHWLDLAEGLVADPEEMPGQAGHDTTSGNVMPGRGRA